MWSIIFATLLMAVFAIVGLRVDSYQIDKAVITNNDAQALAEQGFLYRTYVMRFAAANPGFTGVVPVASLGLPTWYANSAGWSNYISSGRGEVFPSAMPNFDAGFEISKKSGGGIMAGISRSGKIYTSGYGDTGIVTMVPHPDGLPVLMF